jgi:hypothetical protein
MSLAAIEQESSKISPLLSISTLKNTFKVSFLTKGEVLIYLVLSKDKKESVTSLNKQLEILHLAFISITTSQILEHLRQNPSYDVVNEFCDYYHFLDNQVTNMVRDPFTFLNHYAPLRFHPRTREQIMQYVVQHKPLGNPYFGMVLAHRTVAAIIKNDKKIDLVPAGKSFLRFKLSRYQCDLQLHPVKEAEDLGNPIRSNVPPGYDRGVPTLCLRAQG